MAQEELEIKIRTAIDAAQSAKTLGELKASIRDLKGLALQAEEGGKGFDTLTDAIGGANHKLKELNEAIATKSGNAVKNLVGAIKGIGQVGVAGFETLTGAASLFGDQTGEVSKQLVKLQGLMVFERGITQLSEAGDTIQRSFAVIKSSVLDFYTRANNATLEFARNMSNISFKGVLDGIQSFASSAISAFSNIGPAFSGFVSSVTAFVSANPLLLIVAAIAAIVLALSAMIDDFKPLKLLFEGIKYVVTAVIQAVKDFLDWLGLTNFKLQEQTKLTIDNAKAQQAALEERYDEEISMAKITGANVKLLELKKAQAVADSARKQIEALDKLIAKNIELDEEQKKVYEDAQKAIKEYEIKAKETRAQGIKDQQEIQKKAREESIAAMNEGAAKNKAMLQLELDNAKESYEQQKEAAKQADKNIRQNKAFSGKEMERLYIKEKETNDKIDAAYNAKQKAIRSKYYKEDKSLREANNKKKIEELNKVYDVTLSIAENEAECYKNLGDRKRKEALATFTTEVNAAEDIRKENKDNLAIATAVDKQKIDSRDKYFNAVKDSLENEKKAEIEVYNTKLNHLNALAKFEDEEGVKKINAEKTKLAEDLTNKLISLDELRVDEFKKSTEESIAIWKASTDERDILYKADLANLTENKEFEKKVYAGNNAKIMEIELKFDRDKKALEEQYRKDIDKDNEEIDNKIRLRQGRSLKIFKMQQDEKKQKLQDNYQLEVQLAEGNAEKLKKIEEDYQKRRRELDKETIDELKKNIQTYADAALNNANNLVSGINAIQQQGYQQDLAIFDQNNATKLAEFQSTNSQMEQNYSDSQAIQLANFSGTEEQKAALEKEMAQDKVKRDNAAKMAEYQMAIEKYKFDMAVKKKAFDQNKKMQVANAIITGALAVVNGLAMSPFIPLGIISAATATIATGISIAKILSTQFEGSGTPPQMPTLANPAAAGLGGGSSFGGAGSSAAPKAQTMFRLGQGGPGPAPGSGGGAQKVYVLESDITQTQNRVSVIQARASVS